MRKIKGLRWYMIALVTLGTVLGYLTRNTIAAAAPTLMEERNFNPAIFLHHYGPTPRLIPLCSRLLAMFWIF